MEKHLHIICFTVPYPVNYGGVFDLFYKLEALSRHNVNIHLHCFLYNNHKQAAQLNAYCASIHYYKRSKSIFNLFSALPFIVAGRRSKKLLNNLLQDDYPILMEGTQCTYILNDNRFLNRIKLVRLHNIESIYYAELAQYTNSFCKSIYYKTEAKKLSRYEQAIKNKADFFLCVSPKDAAALNRKAYSNVIYLPVFIPTEWYDKKELTIPEKYCLYQGDLSIATNATIAEELIIKIFSKLPIQFIIAGKNPPLKLIKSAALYSHIKVVTNPANNIMQQLIEKAHITILPSQNTTGVKLKLLNALCNGNFCITDKESIAATCLEADYLITDTAEEIIPIIKTLSEKKFSENQQKERKEMVRCNYNNDKSAEAISKLI